MRRLITFGFLSFLIFSYVTSALSFGEEEKAATSKKTLKQAELKKVAAKALPKDGYTLPVKWGNLGPKLVELGVIDLTKFKRLYGNKKGQPSYIRYLEAPSNDLIKITAENAPFMVTVFWAVGLANKNSLLEELTVTRPQMELMRLASTGGWTLGAKPADELYSNFDIISLTPTQEKLVSDLAQGIYRPCCDNSTAFPDCNHGIALLGLMQLMAANDFSREEILKAALKFNSFWFPQHYLKTALLFHLRGMDWDKVDPREVLSDRYSSGSGWMRHVNAELQKAGYLLPRQRGGVGC